MIIFINAFIENEYLFVINAFIVNEHKYLSWSHAAPIPPSSEEIAQEVVNRAGLSNINSTLAILKAQMEKTTKVQLFANKKAFTTPLIEIGISKI